MRRVERQARAEKLAAEGIKASRRQWVSVVGVTATEIPKWATDDLLPGFPQDERAVWFRGRNNRTARRLYGLDRSRGGRPTFAVMEGRLCSVCDRLLLGSDAERRRLLDESSVTGRTEPCGVDCVAKGQG